MHIPGQTVGRCSCDTAISGFFASRTWEEVNATYDQH
jgi:hypothetical protein